MASQIETPSGKDSDYENFPVGSWLLTKRLRRPIACFYAFARAADDIADSPDLKIQEKVKRLDGFEAALLGQGSEEPGYQKAINMAACLKEFELSPRHCQDLLAAFRQDAVKSRYDGWPDLMAYCQLSAAPVGRFLIDLHGGSKLGYEASDALCAALQVINHLQDCGEDYRTLDRVYLPQDWMAEAGAEDSDLAGNQASPALRRVLDWTIKEVDGLLVDAECLPRGLYSKRLALESAVILQIAKALNKRLGREDPLQRRVELSKTALGLCSVKGFAAGMGARW